MTNEKLKSHLERVAIQLLLCPDMVSPEEALSELHGAADYLNNYLNPPKRKTALRAIRGGRSDHRKK